MKVLLEENNSISLRDNILTNISIPSIAEQSRSFVEVIGLSIRPEDGLVRLYNALLSLF
jgi:hypothetical protein